MKKSVRWILISMGVLAALVLSAVGALAMAPAEATPTPVALKAAEAKGEVTGAITALQAVSLSVDGTAYKIGRESELPTGLKPGDKVGLEFTTEADGGLTVVEVERYPLRGLREPSDLSAGAAETVNPNPIQDNPGSQNYQGDQNQIGIMNTSVDFNGSTQNHITNNPGKNSVHIEGGGSIK